MPERSSSSTKPPPSATATSTGSGWHAQQTGATLRLIGDPAQHPNAAKAADGKRLHRLEPDPIAAAVVQRSFAEFLDGLGLHLIATGLNRDGIPSPSAHDPKRNQHRATGWGKWAMSAVRAILVNPRYTGYQVWNKQRRHEILIDVEDVALGHETRMRWNAENDWIWSRELAHEALISTEDFEAAQAMFAAKGKRARRTPAKERCYVVTGLLRCGICDRRMQEPRSRLLPLPLPQGLPSRRDQPP